MATAPILNAGTTVAALWTAPTGPTAPAGDPAIDFLNLIGTLLENVTAAETPDSQFSSGKGTAKQKNEAKDEQGDQPDASGAVSAATPAAVTTPVLVIPIHFGPPAPAAPTGDSATAPATVEGAPVQAQAAPVQTGDSVLPAPVQGRGQEQFLEGATAFRVVIEPAEKRTQSSPLSPAPAQPNSRIAETPEAQPVPALSTASSMHTQQEPAATPVAQPVPATTAVPVAAPPTTAVPAPEPAPMPVAPKATAPAPVETPVSKPTPVPATAAAPPTTIVVPPTTPRTAPMTPAPATADTPTPTVTATKPATAAPVATPDRKPTQTPEPLAAIDQPTQQNEPNRSPEKPAAAAVLRTSGVRHENPEQMDTQPQEMPTAAAAGSPGSPSRPAEGVVETLPALPNAQAAPLNSPAPTAPSAAAEIEPAKPAPATPVHEIAVRLSPEVTGSDTKVDLHVVERGGRISVDVRTVDVDLTQTLRSNVGELVSRLDASGFKSHTTIPVGAAADSNAAGQSMGQDARQSGSEWDDGGRRQQPSDSDRQQQPGRRARNAWEQYFDDTLNDDTKVRRF